MRIDLNEDPTVFVLTYPTDSGELKTYTVDLEEDTQIHVNHLNEQVCEQPGKVTFWSNITEILTARAKELKTKRAALDAALDQKIRSDAAKAGEKMTEGSIKARILSDESYASLAKEVDDTEFQARIVQTLRNGYDAQGSMLTVLSANLRAFSDPAVAYIGGLTSAISRKEAPVAESGSGSEEPLVKKVVRKVPPLPYPKPNSN